MLAPGSDRQPGPEGQSGLPPGRRGRLGLAGRWLHEAVIAARGVERTRYLTRWLVLGALVGVLAGLLAIAFYELIQLATVLLLGGLTGHLPPNPVGEGSTTVQPLERAWLLPLVTALGGLASGLLTCYLAPQAAGAGQGTAIAAIHHQRGRVPGRVWPVKLLASSLVIGSGGSGGREGPAAQMSASLGSVLGRWLRLNPDDQRTLTSVGMAAGVGAIFRAPLGGAVLAAEVLYRHDLEVEVLVPALIASICSYTVFGIHTGFEPIFGTQAGLALESPLQLLYYGLLGVLCGLGGLLYAATFLRVSTLFQRSPLPGWAGPALGGLLVGGLGIAVPEILHTGYGWVQLAMDTSLLQWPLALLLLLPFAKIVATSLTVGSGGSGGVFGPGMVIGGLLGAAFWRVSYGLLPGLPQEPAPFVIVGMIALFGGIAHTPLAMMLMVAEMTGNLSLLAPAMVAVAVSKGLVGDQTIFPTQLPDRASAPTHRVRLGFPLLATLLVRDAMGGCDRVLVADQPLAAGWSALSTAPDDRLPVVDQEGRLVGVLSRQQAEAVPPPDRRHASIRSLAAPVAAPLRTDDALDTALARLADQQVGWLPVVERDRLAGLLSVRDVVGAYQIALRANVRRAGELAEGIVVFEARLAPDSPLRGRPLRAAGLPSGTLVVSILRSGATVFPRADTLLEAGDLLTIASEPESEPALRDFLQRADRVQP